MEDTKWTWRELRTKCRTPAGLVAVLWVIVWWFIEIVDKTQRVSEHMPRVLRILTSPIAIPIVLLVGIALIFWEIQDIRKSGGDAPKFKLRHHFAVSGIAAVAVVLLGAVVLVITSFARKGPKEIAHDERPAAPTEAPQGPKEPTPKP